MKNLHHFDFKMLALLQTLVHIELIDGCYASQFFQSLIHENPPPCGHGGKLKFSYK